MVYGCIAVWLHDCIAVLQPYNNAAIQPFETMCILLCFIYAQVSVFSNFEHLNHLVFNYMVK